VVGSGAILFSLDAARELHGRLVIIGLAIVDPSLAARLDDGGFLGAVEAQVREPLTDLLSPLGEALQRSMNSGEQFRRLSDTSRAALRRAIALQRLEQQNRLHTEHLYRPPIHAPSRRDPQPGAAVHDPEGSCRSS
jgi:hypothetical protein